MTSTITDLEFDAEKGKVKGKYTAQSYKWDNETKTKTWAVEGEFSSDLYTQLKKEDQ